MCNDSFPIKFIYFLPEALKEDLAPSVKPRESIIVTHAT